MTPMESRSGANKTTVRMFSHEHLDEKNKEENWNRVRVICSQPYRRDVPFGLSFIKFRTAGDNDDEDSVQSTDNIKIENGCNISWLETQLQERSCDRNDHTRISKTPDLSGTKNKAETNSKNSSWITFKRLNSSVSVENSLNSRSARMVALSTSHDQRTVSTLEELEKRNQEGSTEFLTVNKETESITKTPTRNKLLQKEKQRGQSFKRIFAEDNRQKNPETALLTTPKVQKLTTEHKNNVPATAEPIAIDVDNDFDVFGELDQQGSSGRKEKCPVCSGLFRSFEIEGHVNRCLDANEREENFREAMRNPAFSPDDMQLLAATQGIELANRSQNNRQFQIELSDDEDVALTKKAWVQCPVCNKEYEGWFISDHVNTCADRKSR